MLSRTHPLLGSKSPFGVLDTQLRRHRPGGGVSAGSTWAEKNGSCFMCRQPLKGVPREIVAVSEPPSAATSHPVLFCAHCGPSFPKPFSLFLCISTRPSPVNCPPEDLSRSHLGNCSGPWSSPSCDRKWPDCHGPCQVTASHSIYHFIYHYFICYLTLIICPPQILWVGGHQPQSRSLCQLLGNLDGARTLARPCPTLLSKLCCGALWQIEASPMSAKFGDFRPSLCAKPNPGPGRPHLGGGRPGPNY